MQKWICLLNMLVEENNFREVKYINPWKSPEDHRQWKKLLLPVWKLSTTDLLMDTLCRQILHQCFSYINLCFYHWLLRIQWFLKGKYNIFSWLSLGIGGSQHHCWKLRNILKIWCFLQRHKLLLLIWDLVILTVFITLSWVKNCL